MGSEGFYDKGDVTKIICFLFTLLFNIWLVNNFGIIHSQLFTGLTQAWGLNRIRKFHSAAIKGRDINFRITAKPIHHKNAYNRNVITFMNNVRCQNIAANLMEHISSRIQNVK